MDYVRTKPKRSIGKRATAAFMAGGVLLVGGIALASVDFRTQRVDRQSVTLDTVKRGLLEIKVHASGQLLPKNEEYLAAQVTGRVVRVYVKAGAVVKKGDLIAEFDNPQLVASAQEAKSAWEGAVNEQRANRAELQASLLNQQATLMQAKFGMERAQTRYAAQKELPVGIIPKVDLEASRLNADQSVEQLALEQKRFKAIGDSIQQKLNVDQSRVNELAKAMERANDQVSGLRIVAGLDGVVQEMSIDVGQQLQLGASIGRIAQPEPLYAELRVTEREAADIVIGQNASIDTRNGVIDAVVSRINPAVTGGTVIVDADLKGKMPAGARPQLSVDGVIYLSKVPNALYVGRPAYIKSNATVAVYRLDKHGDYATRVPIQIGKLSLDRMQVMGGLVEGDRIVTSETGEWQGKDRILFK